MNETIYVAKKKSLYNTNAYFITKATSTDFNVGGPKNPPNLSNYYQEQAIKNKDLNCKQSKFKYCKDRNLAAQKKSAELTSSHFRPQKQRNTSIAMKCNNKPNYVKKERKNQLKGKRNPKRSVTKIVGKFHHRPKTNNFNKENKGCPRSTYESRSEKSAAYISHFGHTEAFDYERQKYETRVDRSLFCDEQNQHKTQLITKLKKAKFESQSIGMTKSYDLCFEISSNQNTQQANSRTPEQQIAEFEQQHKGIHSQEESCALTELFLKEKNYFKTQNLTCYLEKKQPNITWFKRAIVINWMIEVSESFGCRRESLAIAVNILDRYLALSQPIKLEDLQLIACTALCISNKIDGMVFNIKSLSEQTQNITIQQIERLEIQMIMKLEWKLNPPTSHMWANRMSLQWDMYLDHEYDNLCSLFKENLNLIKFKTEDTEGYNNYRSLMQYIDLALMDVHSLRYHSREVAASFIYLILTKKLKLYEVTQIQQKFPLKSDYLLKKSEFNQFYCEFLLNSFGFTLRDLLPTVQFCATFFILKLCFRLPTIVEQNSQECDMTFEQLCAYQTSNQSNLIALRQRDRQYD